MRITDVQAYVLALPEITTACDGTQDTCLIRVDTDAGITGWGEVDSCPSVVKAVVDAPLSHQICAGLRHALLGADPLAIDVCMQLMDQVTNYYGRTGAGSHAQAGVNIALWDILGKACDQPIYQLLGGPYQTRFRAYCSILFGDTPQETGELAAHYRAQGFTAIKFGWGPMGQSEASDLALVRAAREGAGDEIDILVDAGQVWDWKTALKRAHQFADFNVFWLEEPLRPDDVDGYRRLTAESPLPIAAAEAESRFDEFERLVVDGGLDWIQPDPGRCGISNFVEAGRMACRHHRRVVNHSFKSGITLAASLHALAAVPNTEVCEFCMADSPLRHELTNEIFAIDEAGYATVPDQPGLGISINEEILRKYQQ